MEYTATQDEKDTAIPLFHMEAVPMEFLSKQEGRPVFKDKEYVKIMIPGSKDIVNRPVQEADKTRWPEPYRKFKEGNNTETIIGTPIVEWGFLTPAQVAMCKSVNVLSVEALANLPDQALKKLGPNSYTLQDRAKKFLASANSNSKISELETKLNAALAEIERLKAAPVETAITAPIEVKAPLAIPDQSSKVITGPDGKTWAGKGRKPNWVKEMDK